MRERYTFLTPRKAQHGLIQFDQGHKPEPFTFRLCDGQTTAYGDRSGGKERKAKKAQLRKSSRGSKTSGVVMERVGGRTPPRATPIGYRREFGIRAFER